jgi:hypothetical protein
MTPRNTEKAAIANRQDRSSGSTQSARPDGRICGDAALEFCQ